MLGRAGRNPGRSRRLRVDGPAASRVVGLGWFATLPSDLLIATGASGRRTDQRRARQIGILMRLAAPSLPVAELLRLTGLDPSLTICPDLRGALAGERHEPSKADPSPPVLAALPRQGSPQNAGMIAS